MKHICKMTMSELCKIKNLGKKSIDEIIDKIREYTVIDESISSFPFDSCLKALLSRFDGDEYSGDIKNIEINIKKVLSEKAVSVPIDLYETNPDDYIPQLVQIIVDDDYFFNLFKSHLLSKMKKKTYSTTHDFADIFPDGFIDCQADVIQKLIDMKNIEYNEGYYLISYPSFKEYIHSIKNERERIFLLKKAEGAKVT